MEENKLTTYKPAAETIKLAILQGQYEAAKGVNRIQLAVYFSIGKYISLNSRKGKWGTGALEAISQILRKELPGLRGFSASSMKNMRLFYENWQILDPNSSVITDELESPSTLGKISSAKTPSTLGEIQNNEYQLDTNSTIMIAELPDYKIDIYQAIRIPETKDFPVEDFFRIPFTQHIRIIEGVKDLSARYYYIHRVAEENLSEKATIRLIKEDAYNHRDLMPNNFSQTLPNTTLARKAVMMFKDSYLLDFINVEQIGEREAIDVDEREVEQQIVQNVKRFIMTFGRDFTFVGNQQHLEIYGVEHFPDLLFFNRELNALVVVELKTGEFKTSYLGQLMGYLSILEAKVRKPHENPPIGIVLCKDANREFVEFVIRDYDKPMGVATYKTTTDMPEELRRALPDIEELKKLL
jgi:predicted nuclease of restriction endonuclease-like (RecB) superfamily